MPTAKQGFQLVNNLGTELVVSMIEFQGQVFVATESRVFRLNKAGDKLVEIPFEVEP
tara:strand:- start:1243 stop:1413 length:171 start_codon:yes stop_codon:yes gene_type:complete